MTKQNLAPKILADFLKNFFVRIVENINKKISHTNANYKNSVINLFFLKPLNMEELNTIINQMKANKVLGPNSIPTKIPKMSQQIIAKPLRYLINLSFSTGVSE